MAFESILITALLAAVGLALVLTASRNQPTRVRRLALTGWVAVSAAMAWATTAYSPPIESARPVTDRPIEVHEDGYVSSRACKACHPQEYGTWYGSYHRTMTTLASPDTVLAEWDGVETWARGQKYVLERRGDEYWVQMDDPEWIGSPPPARIWRRMVQITGSHNFQFFWTATGKSRKLSILPVCYRLVDEPRWMPLDGCCVGPPTSGQESETGRWNRVCNKCHSTHARPRVTDQDQMDTLYAELGIACEACHGPGLEHMESLRDPRVRYAAHLGEGADPTIVDPEDLTHERSSQVCGQCHGITLFNDHEARREWNEKGFAFRPGADILETRHYKKTGDDKFWSDGMVRVSGREYNGLLESPCYQAGAMTCLSCHRMHKPVDDPRALREWADDQLHLGMEGDSACTQCHDQYTDDGSVAAHTYHAPESSGSRCYNCHMPYTTYGLLKGIRSHTVSSPSAQETIETGRPNACNQCHLDQTLEWTGEHLADWYGIEPPELSEDQRTIVASVLWALTGDAGQRALTAFYMGWDEARATSRTEWMTPFLALLMNDDYHAVRYISARSMKKQAQVTVEGYDFADSHEERYAATLRAVEAWNARGRAPDPAMLIDERGQLNMEAFNRLLTERDLRPVTLNE